MEDDNFGQDAPQQEPRNTRGRRKTTRDEGGRAQRKPMTGATLNMDVPEHLKDRDYEYRWVNDISGRVRRFQEAGYETVTDDAVIASRTDDGTDRSDGTVIRAQADKNGSMGGMKAVLMRQRREHYDEDQAAKRAQIRKVEAAIEANRFELETTANLYDTKTGKSL